MEWVIAMICLMNVCVILTAKYAEMHIKITVFSAVMVKITYHCTVSLTLQILCKKITYAAQNLKVLHSQPHVTLGQSAETTATNANA